MTAHTCTALTPGCFRCDLNSDEIQSWIDTLLVTRSQVVHERDCSFISGVTSSAVPWEPVAGDRACTRCLPDGLPGAVS